ncbi:MAG: hypothetical protein GY796_13310 [Chloroflexi bacterium]|nr:hypothetical protein [Chloroflexota bacterium]
MQKKNSVIGGVILIGVGVLILLGQLIPGLADLFDFSRLWPLIFVAIGGLMLLSAVVGSPELAIPGSVLTGLGLLLFYQNTSGNWSSWAYAWALIPGFVGIGQVITSSLDKTKADMRSTGLRLILISVSLFAIFAFFFNFSWNYWPILLIIGGLWLLLNGRKQ